MNHLLRDAAPITEAGWTQIDQEAARSLRHFLAARRLVDFVGPLGWEHSAVDLGRVEPLAHIAGSVSHGTRRVLPLVELVASFRLSRAELATADRGATDVDLQAVIDAARDAALA